MSIAENIQKIREEINRAAIAAGRDPASVALCAATKMNSAENVRQAIVAGVDCCGENRVQELVKKQAENAYEGAPVHFIGHLQTNKVRQVVGKVSLIQSVDSLRLLESIQTEAQKQNIIQDILLEINIANEESKSGFKADEVFEICEKVSHFSNIRVLGLMAIPPISQNSGDNRKFFQKIYNLSVDITTKKYDNVLVRILSMGMSDDFQDAIACGSTMIRIGTAIFGQRDYSSKDTNI